MATHLIIAGHGGRDPGAVGNGTNERDFIRGEFKRAMDKYSSMLKQNKIVWYDTSRNMFDDTRFGWGMYGITSSQYATVTEFHLDSASPQATGGHVIISSSFNADKVDLACGRVIRDIVGLWGSVQATGGVNKRNNLLNLNVAHDRGINYRLIEIGFITSAKDMANIRREINKLAKGFIESITGEKVGVTVSKKVIYQDTAGLYEAIVSDDLYLDANLSKKSAWRIQKGQRWYLEDIVKVGKYTRAKIRLNNDIRYCTMRDDYWKLISRTKAKKIK